MKNVKNLLVATVALISLSSSASLMQPHVPTTEDANFRVSAGVQGGLVRVPVGTEKKFGAGNLGLGVSFVHNVAGFEYGLAVAGNLSGGGLFRLFSDEIKSEKMTGALIQAELLARFMPQVAESLHLGGFLTIGFSHFFGGGENVNYKALRDAVTFGDLDAKVGLAVSYGITDMFSLYFAPAAAMNAIRFVKDDAKEPNKTIAKETANLFGLDLTLGTMIGLGENVGLFVETTTKFIDIKKAGDTWAQDVALGVSFQM